MTKLQIAGVVIAAGLAAAVVQQTFTNGKLREENRTLAQQLSQMDDLRAENERLAKARTNTSGALNEEQLKDLLRLRGQVSGLKGQLAEAQQLVERNEKVAKLAAMKHEEDHPEEPPEQRLAVAKLNFMHQSVLAALMFAQDNKGQFPTNFDQTVRYGETNYSKDNIDLNVSQFELVYHGALSEATNPAETIAIREKEPVQNATGGWIKAYSFVDGHSEIHKGPDNGNFGPWENEHMQKAVPQ